MDLNSPEFYTIAFVVAMALVALLMGRREKGPSSTFIVQLATSPDEDGSEDVVTLRHVGGGRVVIERRGFTLAPEETVNLVITINGDQCEILEKKGIKRRGAEGLPAKGEVTVKCLRPMKYRIRYESQLTSTWATFSCDASSDQPKKVSLNF